jgi:exodeoxyribonuclease VII small subunit
VGGRRCVNLHSSESENRYFESASPSGNDCCINFDLSHEKDWTLPSKSCITIRDGAKTPLPKFEECLQRLEQIVQELEKGEVPLEKSLTLFEEGMQLSSACRKELEQAEGRVEILLKKNGKLQAEPFEALTEKSPARR